MLLLDYLLKKGGKNTQLHYTVIKLWTCLVDYNNNYIKIEIDITRNTRYYNVIYITIHLFNDSTILEP